MSLDIFMYCFVVIVTPVIIFTILRALKLEGAAFYKVGLVLVAWLIFTTLVNVPRLGPLPGAAFSIFIPILAFRIFYGRSAGVKSTLANASITALVAIHSTRLVGGLFIALHGEGRLSNPFAVIAGSGDMITAILAMPAAYIAWRNKTGWEFWVLAWNYIGFLDFVIELLPVSWTLS